MARNMIVIHPSVVSALLNMPATGPILQDRDKAEEEVTDPKALLCRTCGQPVTRARDRISVNGQHQHALFNPMGILFEVGCFAVAPGCRFDRPFTQTFTWFPGYAWRFAMCRQCGVHLGWEYRSEADGFVGLILTELIES